MSLLATLDLWGQLARIFQAWHLDTNVRGIICMSKRSNADITAYRDSCSFLHCSLFIVGYISKSNTPHCGTRPRARARVFYSRYLFLQPTIFRGILMTTRQSPRNISEPSRCPGFQVSRSLWRCSPYKRTFRGEALSYRSLIIVFTHMAMVDCRKIVCSFPTQKLFSIFFTLLVGYPTAKILNCTLNFRHRIWFSQMA